MHPNVDGLYRKSIPIILHKVRIKNVDSVIYIILSIYLTMLRLRLAGIFLSLI